MPLAFTLSMPGRNSWNGKWSGSGRNYVLIRGDGMARVERERRNKIVEEGSFTYSFGDGWIARVEVKRVDAKQAARLKRTSEGFSGYDWMVESILDHGRILNDAQIEALKQPQQPAVI